MEFREIDELKLYLEKVRQPIKSGTLRFYGDWFGRPMDNCHTPIKISIIENTMSILFDDGFIVNVINPIRIRFQEYSFSVREAKSVRYEYGNYGNPNEQRSRFIEYNPENDWIVKKSGLIDNQEYSHKRISSGGNAFEIIGRQKY